MHDFNTNPDFPRRPEFRYFLHFGNFWRTVTMNFQEIAKSQQQQQQESEQQQQQPEQQQQQQQQEPTKTVPADTLYGFSPAHLPE